MDQSECRYLILKSNDELIYALIQEGYIHSINVEKVFRSVDRGLYYTTDNEVNPYRDTDWQSGDVHLCSPSDDATILECLDLHKGHKFLNIGSGIGYLSTLAGLLLGINGVNHGIEIQSSLINIAHQKLEVFKQNSAAIDYFEFCEPLFIKGNACELMSFSYYDRVNCGAEVPPEKSSFMKSLIKIGGVLVMPLDGVLVQVTRIDENSWRTIEAHGITIPDLVVEKCSSMNVLKFPTVEPLSLKELCRSNIRASIRNCLNESQPSLQMRTKCKPNKSFNQKLLDENRSRMIYIRDCLNEFFARKEVTADQYLSETIKKGSEAKSSEQNKTFPEKPEKTMRMNTILSSTVENLPDNHFTNSRSRETMSNDSYKSHDDEEIAKELIYYRFLSNRKENELSKLLKVKINLLPVPSMLKVFLNYNIDD